MCFFLCVFFFPRKSSHAIHSFDFRAVFFFRHRKEKKTAFSFIHQNFSKKAQKRTYPRKKKIRYLCPNPKKKNPAAGCCFFTCPLKDQILYLFKTPSSYFKKKRLQSKIIEISGCCPSVFCIFSYWGPLVSRQLVFFFQYFSSVLPKKEYIII